MKKVWLVALSLCLASGLAHAERWQAQCTDGKNFHYLQNVNGEGYLYVTVSLPNSELRVFPFARLKQTLITPSSICGELENGLKTRDNRPVTQFCMNRDRKLIYLKSQDPLLTRPEESGKYCDASITVTR